MRTRLTILLAALAVAAAAPASARAGLATGDGDGGFTYSQVGSSFDFPVDAENAPGFPKLLFVVERGGIVRVVKGGSTSTFLDIEDRVSFFGEEGLLSIAFHPGYARNRLFYVYFTNNEGDNVVMEYRRRRSAPHQANVGTERQVLYVSHPFANNHNGGELQFGPDGLLYLSTGDGGGFGDQFMQSQDRDSLLGKLIRIDPRRVRPCPTRRSRRTARRRGVRCGKRRREFTSPSGNPYAGPTRGNAAIYSIGLRNPFRFSFDASGGEIAIGDVGQACIEEIDFRNRGNAHGANFGWARWEGTETYDSARSAPGAIFPIFQYSHGGGCPDLPGDFEGAAVIVGPTVRDPRLPAQYGRLLFADYTNPDIRSMIATQSGASDEQSTGVPVPAGTPFSFAEGANRMVYVISGSGPVYRLDPAP